MGAGNDVLIGGTGADTLIGNVGNDWISGDAGSDILLGGSGRDILVGGTGVDRLNQSTDTSGADDDILIGGSPLYDTSTSAILAILSEWSNTSNSFTARVTKLKTTGITGGYKLTNTSPLPTVSDNGVVDTLFGGAGQDWYFAKRPGETTDATSTDEIAQQVNL
jgi:hypothetical protein